MEDSRIDSVLRTSPRSFPLEIQQAETTPNSDYTSTSSIGRVNELLSKTKTKHPKTTTRLHPQHPSKTAFSISQLLPHANAAPNASLSRPGISHLAPTTTAQLQTRHPPPPPTTFLSSLPSKPASSISAAAHKICLGSIPPPTSAHPSCRPASHNPPCPIPPRHTSRTPGALIGGGNVTGTVTSLGCSLTINKLHATFLHTRADGCSCMQCHAVQLLFEGNCA
jgi:hypothetical protein